MSSIAEGCERVGDVECGNFASLRSGFVSCTFGLVHLLGITMKRRSEA
jgi:hypothetical protein